MSPPWMPFYIADYRADTAHLSAAEHGAYLLLIMHYWQKGGLPNDDRQLARIACMAHGEWEEARPVVSSFFGPEWSHARIDAELAKASEKHSKRVDAGRRGGISKANREQNPSNANSNANSNALASSSQPQPDSSPPTQEAKASFVAPKGKKLEECFERFWAAYPRRDGPNPKAPSFDKFAIAVKNGADPEMIVNSAGRYADEVRAKGKERTEFVKQALTWLNQKLWKDYAEADSAPRSDAGAAPPSPDMPSNEAMLAKYSKVTTDAADGSRASDAGELPPDGPRFHQADERDRQAPVLRGQGQHTGMVGLGSVLPAAFRRPSVGNGPGYERPEPQGVHRPGKVA
jgi:uncharacterized protein YdaU (DUF1376 family)